MRKDEGKGDRHVLARLTTCVTGAGLEGLRRGQDDMMLECWSDNGWFTDSTQEGRQAMRVAADVLGQLGKG